MRTEFRDIDGNVVGVASLDRLGAVVLPNDPLGENLRQTCVVTPGPIQATPADCERYLRLVS